MASSGSFSGSIKDGHYILRVDWSQVQDVSNNKSTVTCKMYLVNDWRLAVSGHYGNTCTIDGTSAEFWSPAVDGTGTYYMDTVSQTVTHDSDGSKSLTITAVYAIAATISGTYYSKITATATITLDSIPRASSVSMSTGTMGSASTITISRASSSFTHTLTYTFGSATGTITTKTTSTSVSWTPALTLANQIPNATSGTCTIKCTTYNGSTSIGSKSITVTLKVPTSVKPTITSLTATRVDGTVPSTWGVYVQGKSKATLTINGAAGSYGSTISSYSISGGGFSSTASSFTTGFLNTSGTITFTATVTDSRGRVSDSATVQVTVQSYGSPFFTGYLSQRCNSSGAVTSNGTYAKGKAEYAFSPCGGKNTITGTATYYRKSGTTSWTNANKAWTSGVAFVFGNGTLSTDFTYEVKYTVTDAFGTASIIDTVSTASVVMDFKYGGTGVAVGKVSETDKMFEVTEQWDVKVYGMLLAAYIEAHSKGGGITFAACDTDEATAAKVATSSMDFKLEVGAVVAVKFTNSNTASTPTLNVNGTGVKYMVSYANYSPGSYYWKPGQTVLFIYDGTYFTMLNMSTATTTYYGMTKLSSSVSSTSTSLAATPSAVKQAYDRNSWDSITLTNALGLAYGGTGATTAAGARTNLGLGVTSLYNGTLTTGSTTFSRDYDFYIIIGQPSSGASRAGVVIPKSIITTTAVAYQFADETSFYSFNLSYSGSTVTLAYKSRSASGQILRIFGVI